MPYAARWSIEVHFGRKPELLVEARKWDAWATQRGWPPGRVMINVIGGSEARVEFEYVVESLTKLEQLWGALPHDDQFKEWQKAMASLVVPGSPRWEIWRVIT